MRKSWIYAFLTALTFFGCQGTAAQKIKNTDAAEFTELMKSAPEKTILDVRTAGEFNVTHIPGAINIDVNDPGFESAISALDKSKPVFVYCLAGSRSAAAAGILEKSGFSEIINLTVGMAGWNAAGLPTESGSGKARSAAISMEQYKQWTESGDTLVLIDFYADWCAPCKKMKPVIGELETEMAGMLKVREINYDENTELLASLKINTVPYLRLYKNGELIWDHPGAANREEIKSALDKAR